MRKIYAVTCLLLIISLPCFSKDIEVGGASIRVVSPDGFVAVTEDANKELFDFFRNFVAPTNIEYAHFISGEDFDRLRVGDEAAFERRFAVQVVRKAQDLELTTGKFEAMKASERRQLEKIAELEGKVNKIVSDQLGNVESKYDIDMGFKGINMSALPVHLETDRALAYSFRVTSRMNDEAGNPSVDIGVGTTTLVELNGRAIVLYAWGGEADLDWSRTASRQWMEAMLAANPSRQAAGWFYENWPPRVLNAIPPALFAMIIAVVVGWFADRRRRKLSK